MKLFLGGSYKKYLRFPESNNTIWNRRSEKMIKLTRYLKSQQVQSQQTQQQRWRMTKKRQSTERWIRCLKQLRRSEIDEDIKLPDILKGKLKIWPNSTDGFYRSLLNQKSIKNEEKIDGFLVPETLDEIAEPVLSVKHHIKKMTAF